MIIEFSLANYRSFHSVQTISFKATGLVSEDKDVDEANVMGEGKNRVLKMIGLYGANASGKSNLIKGLSFFQAMVQSSLESDRLAAFGVNPFKLSEQKEEDLGYFQIILLIGNNKYRYGFTLDDNANIQSEWLFGPAGKNETYYFKRDKGGVTSNADWFKEGASLPYDKLRTDALFLTFSASYDGETSRMIKEFITRKIRMDNSDLFRFNDIIRGTVRGSRTVTDSLIAEGKKDVVLQWMKEAGLIYNDVTLRKIEITKNLIRSKVIFSKNTYDTDGGVKGKTEMDLDLDESEGTKKFYAYIGDLYDIFNEGGVFVSDEVDSSFHPSLLRKLITLFQNSDVNNANAQLLFTSHDTNLMKPDYMRRDQFYFAEKTITEETRLYSLSDLKGIRNNADFAAQYLAGFYGALPQLGNYLEEKAEDKNISSIQSR
jgi:AAA15 family ATPase/GTPase